MMEFQNASLTLTKASDKFRLLIVLLYHIITSHFICFELIYDFIYK